MAMNKKELAIYEGALRDAQIARALRWSDPEPILPDLPIPGPHDPDTSGWEFFVYDGNFRIEQAWSDSFNHGGGPSRRRGATASQRGVALYSTRERAAAAVRQKIERDAAETMLRLDRIIAGESP